MFQVISTTPSTNAVDVDINITEILIGFNEDLDPSTVTDLVLSVGVADSSPFDALTGSVDLKDSTTIRFVPDNPLDYQTRYIVVVTGGSFGVRSSSGRTLGTDYLYYFTTLADPSGQQPAEQPISGISLSTLTSQISIASWTAEDGVVTINLSDTPSSTPTVTITSRHPLGYLGVDDYWGSNAQPVINGSQITIDATSVTLPLTIQDRLLKKSEQLLMEDSIPVLSYMVNASDITATLDFAVNMEYTIQVNIPGEGTLSLTFLPYMAPSFITVEEAKYTLKGLSAVFTSDDELAVMIYLESKRAYQLWTGNGNQFPTDKVPYYAQQFVMVRLVKDAFDMRQRRDLTIGAPQSIMLGDLKVALSDPAKVQQQQDLQADLEELNQLEYIYGELLRKGDTRDVPIHQPAYSLMASEHNYGVIGLVPSIGRPDPTYNPDFKRDLDYVAPKRRTPGPEID